MERLLRRALQSTAARDATPECVDPETLAAWMDGALSGDSLAGAEQHASNCARCQAMLASMARTAPPVAPRPSWQMLTARWLVPFAAAATALVLWVAVDRERATPPAVRPPQVERTDVPSPSAASGQDRAAESYPALVRPSVNDDRLASRLEPGSPGAAEGPQPTPPRERGTGSLKSENRDAAVPEAQALDRRAASRDRADLMYGPAPAASAPRSVAEAVTVTSESPRVVSGGAAGGRTAQGPVEIASPEPAFRWRLVAPAGIQRSTDGGVTWISQSQREPGLSFLGGTQKTTARALPSVTLNAGSAPARDICWVVGSEGIVLLSADGMSWQRRPFSEPVNLTAVRAVDAKAAVVTTEDGRQFSTADGGATWSKIP